MIYGHYSCLIDGLFGPILLVNFLCFLNARSICKLMLCNLNLTKFFFNKFLGYRFFYWCFTAMYHIWMKCFLVKIFWAPQFFKYFQTPGLNVFSTRLSIFGCLYTFYRIWVIFFIQKRLPNSMFWTKKKYYLGFFKNTYRYFLKKPAHTIFSRPGRSQGLLYKHLRYWLIHSVMVCENIFTAPPRPNGCRWCFQS